MLYKRTLFCKKIVFNDDGRANCYIRLETKGNTGVSEIGAYINYFALQKAKFGVENIFS